MLKSCITCFVAVTLFMILPALCEVEAQSHAPTQRGQLTALYVEVPESTYAKLADRLPMYLKFCGYNTVEILDQSFAQPDSKLQSYYEHARNYVDKAHQHGMKIYVILLTNESRRLNVKNPNQNEYSVLFNPTTQPAEYQQRLREVESAIDKGFAKADGFEVFAGDPGGCVGQGCDLDQFLRFGKAYNEMVKKLGTGAEVTLNGWAVGNWGGSLGVAIDFWNADTNLSEALVDRKVPFGDAINLDGADLYRFLVFQLYEKAGRPVPVFPTRATVEAIHAQGKRAYLWPYFIVDDDESRPMTFNKVHFEVRYIQQLARTLRSMGFDGSFANACSPEPQMGNVYAYAQLSRKPDTPVPAILHDFAALIAQPGSVDRLTDVFTFMENRSWWSSQMPQKYRLKTLPCKLTTYENALSALSSVQPLQQSAAPLLISPEEYLARVHSMLIFMKEHYSRE